MRCPASELEIGYFYLWIDSLRLNRFITFDFELIDWLTKESVQWVDYTESIQMKWIDSMKNRFKLAKSIQWSSKPNVMKFIGFHNRSKLQGIVQNGAYIYTHVWVRTTRKTQGITYAEGASNTTKLTTVKVCCGCVPIKTGNSIIPRGFVTDLLNLTNGVVTRLSLSLEIPSWSNA